MKTITKREGRGRRVQSKPLGKSRTQQQFQKQCDVNIIMARYKSTGQISHLRNGMTGRYADMSNLMDYQDMLNTVQSAQDLFSTLPADVRLKFANDPAQLITYLNDPKNLEESYALGLRVKPAVDPLLKKMDEVVDAVKTQSKNP